MWDSSEQAWYWWNEQSGETTWEEPTRYRDYVALETGKASAGLMTALRALYVLQCAIRRFLARTELRKRARLKATAGMRKLSAASAFAGK